jgi:regulator of cell morphogenesis and NO signaling
MDPIEYLLDEHRAIMVQIADLRRAVADLAVRGDAALPDVRPVLNRIGKLMETTLALHAKKEDDVLFPALEAVIGAEGGPTSIMREEHKEIHGQGELLRRTVHELHEVEHPKIEAGKEKLKALAATGGSAESIRANAEEIIRLLDMHFAKEEQILFPMAENILDHEVMDEVLRKMEAMTL